MSSSMRDFKVVQLLGKGSFGSVYKCKRVSDGLLYAVKEVNIKKLSSREREDAVNEIRILASISHVNIIRYCDAFLERDNLYIVMAFAEHGDVYRQIKKFKAANKYIKEDTIWSYLIQMCAALRDLHSRRILHRDIKPKNVFLTAKNHIRVGDLGCAKLMKSGLARTQIGTPYYMSPELWSCSPYDDKSDMWAVGCFIFELCMLNPPFVANDMNGLARKVKTQSTPRVSKHYSTELQDIIYALLQKSPRLRPSCEDVLRNPAVQRRMSLAPMINESTDRVAHMLATIKVPRDMRRVGRMQLPQPSYPDLKAAVAAEDAALARAAMGAAAGGGGGGGAPPSGAGKRAASPLVSPGKRKAQAKAGGGGGVVRGVHGAADPRFPAPSKAKGTKAAGPTGVGMRRVASDGDYGRRPGGRPPSRARGGAGMRPPSAYGRAPSSKARGQVRGAAVPAVGAYSKAVPGSRGGVAGHMQRIYAAAAGGGGAGGLAYGAGGGRRAASRAPSAYQRYAGRAGSRFY